MSELLINHLGTALQAIMLALLAWNAKTTHETALKVAAIDASIKAAHEKDQSHDRELADLRARITQCEIALAALKGART